MLLNFEFITHTVNGSGDVTALSGWTIVKGPTTAEGDLRIANGGFSLAPITNQDWVLRLSATASGNTRIEQSISTTAGKIIAVTAYVSEVQGDVFWGVVDGSTVLTALSITSSAGFPGDAGAFVTKRYTVPPAANLKVYFEADDKLTFSGRGILDVANVCIAETDGPTTTTSTTTSTTTTTAGP